MGLPFYKGCARAVLSLQRNINKHRHVCEWKINGIWVAAYLRQKHNILFCIWRKPDRHRPVRWSSITRNWEQTSHIVIKKKTVYHLFRHKRGVRERGRFWYRWGASGCWCLTLCWRFPHSLPLSALIPQTQGAGWSTAPTKLQMILPYSTCISSDWRQQVMVLHSVIIYFIKQGRHMKSKHCEENILNIFISVKVNRNSRGLPIYFNTIK